MVKRVRLFGIIAYWDISAQRIAYILDGLTEKDTVIFEVNSYGGNVLEGIAIIALIERAACRVEMDIMGVCASMMTAVAVRCAEVRMSADAFFMLHRPWTITEGDADQLMNEANVLLKMENNMVRSYAKKSAKTEAYVKGKYMKSSIDSWLSAEEAVGEGLVDKVYSPDANSPVAKIEKPGGMAEFRKQYMMMAEQARNQSNQEQQEVNPSVTEKIKKVADDFIKNLSEHLPEIIENQNKVSPKPESNMDEETKGNNAVLDAALAQLIPNEKHRNTYKTLLASSPTLAADYLKDIQAAKEQSTEAKTENTEKEVPVKKANFEEMVKMGAGAGAGGNGNAHTKKYEDFTPAELLKMQAEDQPRFQALLDDFTKSKTHDRVHAGVLAN